LQSQNTTARQYEAPGADLSSFTTARQELDEYNASTDVRVVLNRRCGGERGNLCGGDVNINVINESS
jgi:hypothetical protein